MSYGGAGMTIITIAATVVVFLVAFGIVLAIAGPAQSEGRKSKKRREYSIDPSNLSSDEFEYGFETAAPKPSHTVVENRSDANQQKPQSYSDFEYGFENVTPETTHVRPQKVEPPRPPVLQQRTSSTSSYKGENFDIDKLGHGGKCRMCESNVNLLYRFTLKEDGKSESANLCAKCCKKLIARIEKG